MLVRLSSPDTKKWMKGDAQMRGTSNPSCSLGLCNILEVIAGVSVQLIRKSFQTYLRVPSVPSSTF